VKIIDEKGKLFGLINVVDLLVIILIVAIVGGVGYRLFSKKINANNGNVLSEKQDVYVTLYSSLVVPEVAENLKVGEKLAASGKYTNAEIVSITSRPANLVNTDFEGNAVLTKHPLWKDVIVVVKEKVNPSDIILKVATQEVRVGYSFILKTQTVETNCKIRGVSFDPPDIKNIEEE